MRFQGHCLPKGALGRNEKMRAVCVRGWLHVAAICDPFRVGFGLVRASGGDAALTPGYCRAGFQPAIQGAEVSWRAGIAFRPRLVLLEAPRNQAGSAKGMKERTV